MNDTDTRLDVLRGSAEPRKHNARTIAALTSNPGCARRSVLDAASVDKQALAQHIGYPAAFGLSSFAIARGNAFEAQVKANGCAELLRLLRDHIDLPLPEVSYDDLNTVAGHESLEARHRRSRQLLAHAAQVTETAETAIAEALVGSDATGIDELTELLIAAKAQAQVAERDRDNAIAQQPMCAELDRRISATQPMVDSLSELSSLLADGKFMAAVVKRRQRALLGIASEVFKSMTEDRFAFSDDFRIVHGHTGQPRDVKTLSGGETFLASLALALALVELTSRGGGRVEALFLDEGFGSLDTNVLGEALEALTRQASGGRLVAVISHMRAVAENFDNVLVVTRTLSGSQAHWATPAERDQLVTDELAAGLLT